MDADFRNLFIIVAGLVGLLVVGLFFIGNAIEEPDRCPIDACYRSCPCGQEVSE